MTPEEWDNTEFTFGKYCGQTRSDVAKLDPAYIVWMYENIAESAHISRQLYMACSERTDDLLKDIDFSVRN